LRTTDLGQPIGFRTAVAFFVYRRPHLARLAFASIRRSRPKRLYFIADAPKDSSDVESCALSRELLGEIDWDCEVRSQLAERHLGCARRIASGVTWVFEQEDRAIFIEEDCIAAQSFFPFCDELLERYASVRSVMMLTGFNLLLEWKPAEGSYSFSHLGSSWGWATWRRAWAHFDCNLEAWTQDARDQVRSLLENDDVFAERARLFDKVAKSRLDSWAVPWNLACLLRGGCCIVPSVNLIQNVGFGDDSTHYKSQKDPNFGVPPSAMIFPLSHPPQVCVDRELDGLWNRKATGANKP